jgi:hypothetical protein
MKNIANKVHISELLKYVPHPVVVESLTNKLPVVVQGVEGIASQRETLGKIIPKLQLIEQEEYGYHTGLLKNDNLVHTHVNPIIDQVAAPTPADLTQYPETYRKHCWPKLPGYREAVKDIHSKIERIALIVSKHLDQHVINTLKDGSRQYQSLEQMIKTSQMSTARSFYYRERRVSDDANKPSFNFHYDRMNLSACLKDFYYIKGNEVEQPYGAGLNYNTKSKELYNLRLDEGDIGFHVGMSYHILSAGIFPAQAHAVYLPNIDGLSRASQAFFFSPSPLTLIVPPINIDINNMPEDDGVVPKHIGLINWQPNMKYTDWNEAIVQGFKKVFFNE